MQEITPAGPADRTQRIRVGDVLIKLNETPVNETCPAELAAMLRGASRAVGCCVCLAFSRSEEDGTTETNRLLLLSQIRVNLVPHSVVLTKLYCEM